MRTSRVRGYYGSQKVLEAEACVVARPLDLLSIDPLTGTFEETHEQAGQSIKGKIVLAPCFCGATIAEFIPLFLSMTGNEPGGFLTTASRAYTPVMSGCLASDTPFLFGLDKNVARAIRTGDVLHFEAATGEIALMR